MTRVIATGLFVNAALLLIFIVRQPTPIASAGTALPSDDCADLNDDGTVDVSDAVFLLNWLFADGSPPLCKPAIEGFVLLGDNAEGFPEYLHQETGMEFVFVPGGSFLMGAQFEDPNGDNYDPAALSAGIIDEGPVHEVTLNPFLMSKFEVTQDQWLQVVGDNPSVFPGADQPVDSISWDQIQLFEERTGFALPSEAQWEYACRSGTSTPIAGTGVLDDMGWFASNAELAPHPVGEKLPNQFGIHDMHGNVKEWVEDSFVDDFYASPEGAGPDPVASGPSLTRGVRGGCWADIEENCRASQRIFIPSSGQDSCVGFRVVARIR